MVTINDSQAISRRHFLKTSGAATATSALLASLPASGVQIADDHTIRLALIGCGGRGTGAVRDALSVPNGGPIKLWAMADLETRLMDGQVETLQGKFKDMIEVPSDRKFRGFQAYKQAIDTLRPGDIALCTTRAYIRPLHVEYAVSKGINVFMEKPFAADPSGVQRILRAADLADKNGAKIAAGLQCRHSPARQALIDKIRAGELGEIPLIRANRLEGRSWMEPQGDRAFNLQAQLAFGRVNLLWVGSGHMVDYLIHQIDECCWIKDAWPVTCVGMGGREPYSTDCGQNHDTYAMEFTFPDGTKAMCGFRRAYRARGEFATWIHGTKCAAQFSGATHAATVHLFKDQRTDKSNIVWSPEKDAVSPWQYEWNDFIDSIRNDKPHNEAHRAARADIAAIMGRAACHSGREIKLDDVMNSKFAFCDALEKLDYDSPVPVEPDSEGRFPIAGPTNWQEI